MSTTSFGVGRYARGAESRPVSGEVRNQIISMLTPPNALTVTQIRKRVKASNLVVSEIAREYRAIGAKRSAARNLTNKARPKSIVVQTGMSFGTEYRYHGVIHIWQYADEEVEEGGLPRFYEEIPAYFGDDTLLSGAQIRERLEAIGEQIAARGGSGRGGRDYAEGLFVHHVVITSVQRSL